MPGNPNSKNIAQRKPYVVHDTPVGRLDKYGNRVARESIESHIPLEEYNYNKIMKNDMIQILPPIELEEVS